MPKSTKSATVPTTESNNEVVDNSTTPAIQTTPTVQPKAPRKTAAKKAPVVVQDEAPVEAQIEAPVAEHHKAESKVTKAKRPAKAAATATVAKDTATKAKSSTAKKIKTKTANTTDNTDNTEQTEAQPATRRNRDVKGLPDELKKDLKFSDSLQKITKVCEIQSQELKALRENIRKLESSYNHDINKALRTKKRKNGPTKKTGFVKEIALPAELADLIDEPAGTLMSMPTYTSRFYAMLKEKKLHDPEDGRILKANDKILKVFNLDPSVNESTSHKDENGFNFCTLQKLFAKLNRRLLEQQVEAQNIEPEAQA